MKAQEKRDVQLKLEAVKTSELQQVSGGLYVDVTGMPDRSVMCGTMWILDRLLKPFLPKR